MDRPPPPLFRQVAVEAASGTQIGTSLTTHWRGVAAFTAVAFGLFAALIAFVALVEYSPVHRVAAFVDARSSLVRPSTQGQSVDAGRPTFTTAPPDDPLLIKLLVAPAMAASVRPGVAFRLAFRDYPQDRFGLFEATVDSVTAGASLPGQVAQAAARGSEPMLVATASLPSALRGPQGEVLPLEPGMRADALVPSERRTLLEWLLDPILRDRDDSVGRARAGGEARR